MFPDENIINHLSPLQLEIIACLADAGAFDNGSDCAVSLRLRDILDCLGRSHDNASYASVSRSLARLREVGIVSSARGVVYLPGKGWWHALLCTPEEAKCIIRGARRKHARRAATRGA
jgi:hypothetical protein